MKTPLAIHNLLHKKVKTGVAVAGVVFAIVLMLMQLGFLEAVKASATVIYDVLDFDVCIRSKDYLHLADARTFPRDRLVQAAGVAGVERSVPFTVANAAWQNPLNGQRRSILCFGVAPDAPVFRDEELQQRIRRLLARSDALLIDTKTRSEYGPQDGRRFGPRDHGVEVELNGARVRIAGDFTRGAGLTSGGAAVMSERALLRHAPVLAENQVSLGLVKLADGARLPEVLTRLRAVLPDDVDVLSRREVLDEELIHWVYETNYGLIFQTGVLVALIVGTAIVYQVLASDVASLMPEYATLKAIGYGNRHLAAVILEQALALALVGFVAAIAIAELLYAITSAGAQIPVRMTSTNLAIVFGLSIAMCTVSGLAAMRKAFRADPADLF